MAKRSVPLPDLSGRPAILEFTVRGTAISARAKGRSLLRLWKEKVAAAARRTLPPDFRAYEGKLAVHIVEFSAYPRKDRDNVAKPILDALQTVAYANDRQVCDLRVEWCDIDGSYKIRLLSEVVAEAMVAGEEFVWVRLLDHVPRQVLR